MGDRRGAGATADGANASENRFGSGGEAPDVPEVRRLEDAQERLADVEARIEAEGEDAVEAAARAYRTASKLLDDYVDRATGTGRENFKAYVQLEGQFASLVEGLPEEIDGEGRAAFEAALDAIDKRRLDESDFERARSELEPAERYADLLDEREDARDELTEARTAASRRLDELADELTERERLRDLATVDLEAPVERLREPIERYDEAVTEAFEAFRSNASAREVFAFLERTRWYPLVDYERPADELREFVETSDAGTEPIPQLLEYADYSRSKLSHVVDDADELKRRVATRRTYLERLDAEPLRIGWPPAPAAELRFRIRELRPLVERVGGEDLVALLREIRELTRDPDYDRLQTAAEADRQLSDEERALLTDGRLENELAALRAERERLRTALEESA